MKGPAHLQRTESPPSGSPALSGELRPSAKLFTGLVGVWLGVVLVKFGNPIIFDEQIVPPNNALELIIQSWPIKWGYWSLVPIAMWGLLLVPWRGTKYKPAWIFALPLVWWVWQIISGTHTVNAQLTGATLKHFTACVACFYLGLFVLSQSKQLLPLWLGLVVGFFLLILVGLDQRLGSLEETRRFYEMLYRREHSPEIQNKFDTPQFRRIFNTPAFQKKLSSNRIFSTFIYPNTFAGAIVLLLPASLVSVWQICQRRMFATRALITVIIGSGALACLFWSGSRSGWLVGLMMVVVVVLHTPVSRMLRIYMLVSLFALGLGGFFVKYAIYSDRGASSIGARFDYWRAALQITKANPVLGTGPGTFSVVYERVKPPEAEMAKLAHNDFLEQASDSGIIGFLTYSSLILGSLVELYRKRSTEWDLSSFVVWLGLLGLFVQSVVEFNLYIPALAWPAFTFLGWLWGLRLSANRVDNCQTD